MGENINEPYSPTICLNMIVRNESKIIERLLKSVLPIIDSYCICDTGSTDNTIEIIKNFFDINKMEGVIISEPWKNFKYNRDYSLAECSKISSDYILLIDADMVLEIKNFKKNMLVKDAYHIRQGTKKFSYPNHRIIKNNGRFNYKLLTHEHINCLDNNADINNFIEPDVLFINDIGDGGSKADKYVRDIKLLLEGIIDEPDNTRYYFYLANSYFSNNEYEKAIEYYKKRISMGGWNQEIWYSYYSIGLIHKKLEQYELAISAWLDGYNILPQRLENLYEIIKYYRETKKYNLALLFYNMCKIIIQLNKKTDKNLYLFLHDDVYIYKLDYEYTIIAYYCGVKHINNEIINILNNSDDTYINDMLCRNMKFYKNILTPTKIIDFTNSIEYKIDNETHIFNSSSPCILKTNDGKFIMNMRYVNYKLDNGRYVEWSKNIMTLNKYAELDNDYNIVYEKLFDFDFMLDNANIKGVEDIRLFYDDNKLMYNGVKNINDEICMVFGEYDINKSMLEYCHVPSTFTNNQCEKNWVYLNDYIVYSWNPLTLCKINDGKLICSIKKETPEIFKYFRGSTGGYLFNSEYWILVHMVSYEMPRHYYHIFVVFNDAMELIKYSIPFSFEGICIEYALGLIVDENNIVISYSTLDNTSKIGIYNKKYIDKNLLWI